MTKRLFLVWIAGLCLLALELGGLLLAREVAGGAATAGAVPAVAPAVKTPAGGDAVEPLRDVLLFPLI